MIRGLDYIASLWHSRQAKPDSRQVLTELDGDRTQQMRTATLRLCKSPHISIVELDLFPSPDWGSQAGPMLYLNTSCACITEYCTSKDRFDHVNDHEPTSWQVEYNSTEHRDLCMRMRRCGAVKVSPNPWARNEDCNAALEQHLTTSRFVFGWPETDPTTPLQPVWVYYISRTLDAPLRQEALRHGGMEEQLELYWLTGCTTMTQFCERLKIHGAVYYDDVRQSTEVKELGLLVQPQTVEDISTPSHYFSCTNVEYKAKIASKFAALQYFDCHV